MRKMQNKGLVARPHPWNVTVAQARKIQEQLRPQWIGEDRLPPIRTIAGLDAAFVLVGPQALKHGRSRWGALREANRAIGCVVLYSYPDLQEIERVFAERQLRFPYVPGFLSFREIPVLSAALRKLKKLPDLLFCDGQGYAHPRRMGLATHLGIALDRPTIGCAKSLLIGTHDHLPEEAGSWRELVDPTDGERSGAAVRTRDGVKPIYVSAGHRVSLPTAIKLTLQVASGFRVPRPTRDADRLTKVTKSKLLRGDLSEK